MDGAAYRRELEWNDPPSPGERRLARWTVVRAAGRPASLWAPLARIGDVDLYLAPPGSEHDAASLLVDPVLAGKRGRRGDGDYPGIDGHVRLASFYIPPASGEPTTPVPPPGPIAPALGAEGWRRPAVRAAVIDVSFENVEALDGLGANGAAYEGPYLVGLATGSEPAPGVDEDRAADDLPDRQGEHRPPGARTFGHGTAMAGILLAEVPGVQVGLFRIPSVAGAARPYLAPTDLAMAIATAVETWEADVVLVAMSDGAWGTPPHLCAVLRAAARFGRRGRGTALFCSVGDPSRNHGHMDDSAALAADDLASQPWTTAVAACDRRGRWYRVYPEYRAGWGVTYNRFGPAVTLAASGEPRRYGDKIAADDSSQAAALAAAAAARVLGRSPTLTAAELRALLALTADVPAAVDGGPGLVAGRFDGRDRLGHSLKLGYGVVNAHAACLAASDPVCLALLATREVPDPDPDPASEPGSGARSRALALAESWSALVRREAARPGGALARDYTRVGPGISRMFLRALPLQEAFGWLARHVRALADTAPGTASPCLRPDDDHGALIDRIRYAAEAIRDIAEEDTAHDDTAQNDNAQDVREDGRRQDLHDAHPGAPPDSDGEAGRWALRLDAALAAASGRGGNGHRLAARVITELLANGRTPDMTPERYWVESDDDGHRGRT